MWPWASCLLTQNLSVLFYKMGILINLPYSTVMKMKRDYACKVLNLVLAHSKSSLSGSYDCYYCLSFLQDAKWTHRNAWETWSGGGEEIIDEPASAEVSLRPLMGEGTWKDEFWWWEELRILLRLEGLAGSENRQREGRKLGIGPKHVSAACCSPGSIAGLQFQPANVPLLRVSAVSFLGRFPSSKARQRTFFFGEYWSHKGIVEGQYKLKLMKSCVGPFCINGSSLYKCKNDY